MSNLKFVLWNMEWMNDLFAKDDRSAQFLPDGEKTTHSSATAKQRRDDLSGVLRELDPDLVVIVEGPSRQEELQLFFDNIGQGKWIADLQPSPGQTQNIGIAVRVDTGKFKNPALQRIETKDDFRFNPFLLDTDNDEIKEQHRFERRPLYVEIIPEHGAPFRVLGLHLKSKGLFDAYEWSKWWEMADANRKKILGQATHIHDKFIMPYLTDKETKNLPLIVCGDINDGPGLDACEKRLHGSGIERLMGTIWQPEQCLGNALFDALKPKEQKALDFSSIYTTRYKDPIFNNIYQKDWIDHILYSKSPLKNWVRNAKINRNMPDGKSISEKYKHSSDHYPVSVEVVTG
ncbi:MAG: Endonuclease/Exonuclease/phosphatase family protein [Methanosaeta sp. PtaU1.Bin112]|nr:MAG: Endonuclease/Exonuclease/phosphatase family protein [Methanosaeta sp. PtaU1.Bin112]